MRLARFSSPIGGLAPMKWGVLGLVLFSGCHLQRLPGPMRLRTPADAEEQAPPMAGPLETVVVRHSDPVFVQRPGAVADYPLPFYEKRDRVLSGGRVRSGYGGRAELFWPGDASSVVLFDQGAVQIGEPTRDEPLVSFLDVTQARLFLTPEDRIALVGGALLRGDPEKPSGPFMLERLRDSDRLVRLTNQSKHPALVAYRDEVLELGPGDSIDLPSGDYSSSPLPSEGRQNFDAEGVRIQAYGMVTASRGQGGSVVVQAENRADLYALGQRITLEPGQQATFSTLGGARADEEGAFAEDGDPSTPLSSEGDPSQDPSEDAP